MAQAMKTIDHDTIRRWTEERQGHPAVVKSTERQEAGHAGLLRIDFDPPESTLEPVSWDDFFETFDANRLAFLYQDETASGDQSRFCKIVSRDSRES